MDPAIGKRAVSQEPCQANRKALEKKRKEMEDSGSRVAGKYRKSVGEATGPRHAEDKSKDRPLSQAWREHKGNEA